MDDRMHDSGFILSIALILGAIGGSAWLFFGQDSDAGAPHSKTVTVTIDGASYVCKPAPHNPSVE